MGCPLKGVPSDVWEAMYAFEFAEDGLMPVAGGLLDQTDGFLEALSYFRFAKANLTQNA